MFLVCFQIGVLCAVCLSPCLWLVSLDGLSSSSYFWFVFQNGLSLCSLLLFFPKWISIFRVLFLFWWVCFVVVLVFNGPFLLQLHSFWFLFPEWTIVFVAVSGFFFRMNYCLCCPLCGFFLRKDYHLCYPVSGCGCFVFFQNGLLSALPYMCFWFVINVSGQVADLIRHRKLMNTTRTRKFFNFLGMKTCNSPGKGWRDWLGRSVYS